MTTESLSGYALRLAPISTALAPGSQGPCPGFDY